MDETGLFYRLEPDATLATGPVKGKKKNKERITVALCANATEMDKQKPLLIARTARPRCFGKDFDPNVYAIYRYNKKAWMTSDLITEWLENFKRTMRSKKRKVLLLLDNATSHKVLEDLQNVRVHFLPPNMTSHLQPSDAGIIRNFKFYYRKGLTKHFLRAIEDDKPMSINLREALRLIKDAWNDVKAQTISKCWEHTSIIARRDLLNDDPTEIGQTEEEVVREISEGLQNLTVIPNEHRMSVNEWLGIDRNEEMGETLSDEAIIEIVQPPAIRENESGESDEEVKNPPRTVTTREATAALETLITYMEQHPRLQHVSDHLHGTWALKRDIDLLNPWFSTYGSRPKVGSPKNYFGSLVFL